MSDGAKVHDWETLAKDSPMPNLVRRRVIGKQAMISHVTLETGVHVPTHHHANEQFVCLLSGRMRFGLGLRGEPGYRELMLAAGQVLELPSNVPHCCDVLERAVVLDIFSPPSATTGIDHAHA